MSNTINKFQRLKILSSGERQTGRSSLVIRKAQNTFIPNLRPEGVEFYIFNLNKRSSEWKVYIWDIYSNERFQRYPPKLYSNSNALIIIYDIASRNSFEKVQGWIGDCIQKRTSFNISFAIAGTKADLQDERQVSKQEGQQLADSLGVLFFETSSKLDYNVNECFDALFDVIFNTQ